ncbi:MAG: DEAD/DEAH box helicase [Pseudomonadota bacterium]
MAVSFESLSLDPRVFDGICDMGYREMTAIQEEALPIALAGHDLIAGSQTGTGKTAVFLIPILDRLVRLEKNVTRALILTPTRELALQIEEQLAGLAYHAGVTSACAIGGLSFGYQERVIRAGTEILIATPGRLIDHMRYDHLDFKSIEVVVLDEADRMLDMGFLPDVRKILEALPTERQTLLFSATIGPEVQRLSAQFMKHPKKIQIGRQVPVDTVRQRFFSVETPDKETTLIHLLRQEEMDSVLIFARTKLEVKRLDRKLQRVGISCDSLHGDRPQEERGEALDRFRRSEIRALVATDVASRGLDISDVSHVINYDIPVDPDDYIHRVGRTARAEKEGEAITFVTSHDHLALERIEKAIQRKVTLERVAAPARHHPQQRRCRR